MSQLPEDEVLAYVDRYIAALRTVADIADSKRNDPGVIEHFAGNAKQLVVQVRYLEALIAMHHVDEKEEDHAE